MDEMRPQWAAHYPQRWDREIEELQATGWRSRVMARGRTVMVEIDWPVAEAEAGAGHACCEPHQSEVDTPSTVLLEVWFPTEYPFFPPEVYDHGNHLGLSRHRNIFGMLCLIEAADWHPDTTVAGLLASQLPGLVVAGRSAWAVPGLEMPVPEPAGHLVPYVLGRPALIMPTDAIPTDVDEGALVLRHALLGARLLGSGLVEHILGDGGLDIQGPPHPRSARDLVIFGRWARDSDFDPSATAQQTWTRVDNRLRPLRLDLAAQEEPDQADQLSASGGEGLRSHEVPHEQIEALCLLVPSENAYRQPGEAWVAMLRTTVAGGTSRYHHLPVQRLGPDVYATRTPQSQRLTGQHVVLVGLGALGSQIAEDLTRTGVGHLTLVDGDHVDVATATRQYAPLYAAGRPKAETLLGHLRGIRPDIDLTGLDLHVGRVTHLLVEHNKRRTLDHMVRTADLVIDATAAPAVTRYLAAIRQAQTRPFLHVSATAGAWGGCVFLAAPGNGCWSCLQHHRLDHSVPVPAADPDGVVTPVGCTHPTFTGTSSDLAMIAHHASRVAIDHLTDANSLGGDLYVAHLRTPDGNPQPVHWETALVPVHPDCPLHLAQNESAQPDLRKPLPTPTAQEAKSRTISDQPREREADGHSPPRAPIPTTQQRKTATPAPTLPSPRRRHRTPGSGDTTRAQRR